MALPSGPLRLAPSASASNKPHTFALRYPASHPSDLSTAGAALSSTASGDVSLRIPPGANPAEPRGRRWAGRQSKSNNIECVVVWDENQHSWILHPIHSVVPLASDDPEPLPKKLPSSSLLPQKPLPLALPKPARPAPPPPRVDIQPNHSAIPPSLSKQALKDPNPSAPPAASSPLQFSHPQPGASSAPTKSTTNTLAASSKAHGSQSILNLSDSSASSSSANGSTGRPAPPPSSLADGHSTSTTNSSQISLALPSKKRALPPLSNSQAPQRTYNHSTLSSTSSSGDHGPLRVVQAEDIEEFDFVDSPPDPEPAPSQPVIAPSPLTLPSPAPPHAPSSTWQSNSHRPSTSATAISPAGRPTLSRSSSVADTNGAHGASPARRPNHGLALPSRSAAQQRSSVPSPAYLHNGLSRSANLSNQPTAPSPLQSVAYSSSSSPADPVQTAPTPVLVSVSPASATATTTETTAAAPVAAVPTTAAALARPGRLPTSISNAGVSSPVPTWQHTQNVQHSFQNISPHGINGTRSPAPLTNQNLGLATNQSASAMPNRTYHRSDSGSSVRESDTDSEDDDDDEDGESSDDEDAFEPVPPPPVPAPVVVQPAAPPEPVHNSEEDAEAEEETDEDEEFELQNFATELEASMMIGDFYGSKAMGSYGESMLPEPVEVKEPPPVAPPPKGKANKKKLAGGNSKAATTTTGGAKKGAAALGTSKAKGKGKAAKNS